jgi:hypothetical protein
MLSYQPKHIPNVLDGLEAFEQWNAKHTHDMGTPLTPDKAIVRAVEKALESRLHNATETVSAADIQHWIVNELRFKIDAERINEHCLYKAGESGTPTNPFPQPKKNPDLRIVRDGVYAVARGKPFYTYETRSHSNK